MPPQTLPPFTLPSFAPDGETVPDNNAIAEQVNPIAGIQLIVWELDRSSQRSALENFTTSYPSIVTTASKLDPPPFLPSWQDLKVVAGNTKRSVDYVFVSLRDDFSNEPRPDVLAQLKSVINAHSPLSADWNIGDTDKARRLYFLPGNQGAEMVKGRVEAALAQRSVPYQHSFIMKVSSGDRVVFDILQRQHVQELLESPIIVNQTTYHAHQSRFIIPKFGYDVAITGCGSIGHFKAGMDAVIRNHFGGQDVIAHSRMELDGDTYVVIMRTCDLAAKLVDSTLPNPSGVPSNIALSTPLYLWYFNARACPAQTRFLEMDSPSHDGTAMQQQVDLLREQVNSGAANFSQILRTQGEQISEIRSANNNLQNAMALASALTDARLRVMAFDGEVARLESDKTTKQMLLLFAAGSPDLKATFSASLEDIQRRLVVVGRDHTAARADLDGLAALNRARLVGQTPLDSQRVGEGPPTNRPRRDDEMNEG